MNNRIFPVLEPEDYAAFRKLIPPLPDRYAEWRTKHLEELRDALRYREQPLEVVVYPDPFTEFCSTTEQPAAWQPFRILRS